MIQSGEEIPYKRVKKDIREEGESTILLKRA
jgi:hypothetical protein